MESNLPAMDARGPVVDEARIASFEQALGSALPAAYRRFLLTTNGGTPNDRNAELAGKHSVVVHVLKSLDEPEDGPRLTPTPEFAADFPSLDLLEIGYDAFGNRIVLVVRGDRRGEVWFQSLTDPQPEWANPRLAWFERRDLKKLADDFDMFLKALGPVDE